nr:MAG TPA: hypothetical protein [Caudoviricetes sp.]
MIQTIHVSLYSTFIREYFYAPACAINMYIWSSLADIVSHFFQS